MPQPDNSFMVLRRIDMASERTEMLYTALHLAIIISVAGILYALYQTRQDLLKAIEGSKS